MKVKEILFKTYGDNNQIVERALRLEACTTGGDAYKAPAYIDIYRDLANSMNIQGFIRLDYVRTVATVGSRKVFKHSTSSIVRENIEYFINKEEITKELKTIKIARILEEALLQDFSTDIKAINTERTIERFVQTGQRAYNKASGTTYLLEVGYGETGKLLIQDTINKIKSVDKDETYVKIENILETKLCESVRVNPKAWAYLITSGHARYYIITCAGREEEVRKKVHVDLTERIIDGVVKTIDTVPNKKEIRLSLFGNNLSIKGSEETYKKEENKEQLFQFMDTYTRGDVLDNVQKYPEIGPLLKDIYISLAENLRKELNKEDVIKELKVEDLLEIFKSFIGKSAEEINEIEIPFEGNGVVLIEADRNIIRDYTIRASFLKINEVLSKGLVEDLNKLLEEKKKREDNLLKEMRENTAEMLKVQVQLMETTVLKQTAMTTKNKILFALLKSEELTEIDIRGNLLYLKYNVLLNEWKEDVIKRQLGAHTYWNATGKRKEISDILFGELEQGKERRFFIRIVDEVKVDLTTGTVGRSIDKTDVWYVKEEKAIRQPHHNMFNCFGGYVSIVSELCRKSKDVGQLALVLYNAARGLNMVDTPVCEGVIEYLDSCKADEEGQREYIWDVEKQECINVPEMLRRAKEK